MHCNEDMKRKWGPQKSLTKDIFEFYNPGPRWGSSFNIERSICEGSPSEKFVMFNCFKLMKDGYNTISWEKNTVNFHNQSLVQSLELQDASFVIVEFKAILACVARVEAWG